MIIMKYPKNQPMIFAIFPLTFSIDSPVNLDWFSSRDIINFINMQIENIMPEYAPISIIFVGCSINKTSEYSK